MTAHITRFLATLAVVLVLAPCAIARQDEPDAPRVPERFESPRATMFTFLEAMGAGRTADATECFDLPPALRAEAGATMARRLYAVLNRIGEVQPGHLPDREQARSRDLRSFTFFPQRSIPGHERVLAAHRDGEIALTRADSGAWRFSRQTLDAIVGFANAVDHLPSLAGVAEAELDWALRLQRMMPASLRSAFLGVYSWQWIGLLLLIFIGVVLDFIVQAALRAGAAARIHKRGGEVRPEALKRAVRPYGLVAAAVFVWLSVRLLGMPPEPMSIIVPALRLIVTVAGVWAAFRTTDLVAEVFAQRAAKTATKFDDLLVPLVRKTLKIFITAIGLIYIAGALNIEIVPLLTGLGIGGLAVAFAAKDTIENFFGSVAVILDRPFEVGDWIKTGDVEGIVEELGFRSTRVRTFYNSLVTVPNASLVRATVDNYGRRRYRRTMTSLNLTYDTPPEKIEAFCEGVRELIRAHPYTRKDFYCVYFNNYGAHSLDVMVYCFHECPDWQTELRERQRLYIDILRVAKRLGVSFAYPTQTLYVNPKDEHPEPPAPPNEHAENAARRAGRDAAALVTANQHWRKTKPPLEDLAPPPSDDSTQIESRAGGG